MSIKSETGELKKVALFGPPGVESYLAQFYPPAHSLFFACFDIIKAREEFSGFAKLLMQNGVEVLDLKKAFAGSTNPSTICLEELADFLCAKVPAADRRIVEHLLADDVALYGQQAAISLNNELSCAHEMPLGNIFFARDQSNMFIDSLVLGKMKYPIRKPEVAIIEQSLLQCGYKADIKISDGSFEGGDGMVIKDNIYLGMGPRTNLTAIMQICSGLGNIKYVRIPNGNGWKSDMQIMHLDTFFMPVAQDTAIGSYEVLQKCSVVDMQSGQEEPFIDHFAKCGIKLLPIPLTEQANYAANLLVLGHGRVVVPSDYNPITTETLSKLGISVQSAGLSHLTNAVGAAHCMVLQLDKQ